MVGGVALVGWLETQDLAHACRPQCPRLLIWTIGYDRDSPRVAKADVSRAIRRVLIVGSDFRVVEEVRRCAIASGVEADEVGSLTEARSRWSTADLVVVADDQITGRLSDSLPSRPGVVVASADLTRPFPWQLAVSLGAARVIDVVAEQAALVELLAARSALKASVLAVTSGSGGAGASVTSAALVMAAATKGLQSVLLDADPQSPGADLLVGLDQAPGLRWDHLNPAAGPPPGDRLFSSLPRNGNCAVLTRDRTLHAPTNAALIQSTIHTLSAAVDLIVVDMARGYGALGAELLPLCDVVYVVVTCDVRGATSAMAFIETMRDRADLRLLTRLRPGDSLDPEDVADWLRVPLAVNLPHESGIISMIDRGEPVGSQRRSRLASACSELIREITS